MNRLSYDIVHVMLLPIFVHRFPRDVIHLWKGVFSTYSRQIHVISTFLFTVVNHLYSDYFAKHIDIIRMGLSIIYFKGSEY